MNDSGTAPADLSQLPPEELRKLKGQSLPAPSQPKLLLRSNVVVTPEEAPADLFFLSEPVAFRRVYGLNLTHGPAGIRSTTGSLSATQE